jgi:[protein-PII] uridylyltransferase
MSMMRPASTGAQPPRGGASAGQVPPSPDTASAGQAPLKASLDVARHELRAAITRGAGGRAALEHYADRVDALIRQLFTDAGGDAGPVAIVALGGYGRRHLCLHSDIDLLLLFGGGIGSAEERFVHSFLNPLWDLGVVIGHQVREIEDFQVLERDNPEFLLALLDARPVAGVRSVFERFGTIFHQPETHAFILRSLLALIDERHARFNGRSINSSRT